MKVVVLAACVVLHHPFLEYSFKLTSALAGAAAVKPPTPSSLSDLQHLPCECCSSKTGRLLCADDAVPSTCMCMQDPVDSGT